MRILFIKLKHIGDTLILTPTLAATRTKYPDALIWVVVRKGCEDILKGCPYIDRILTTAAPEAHNRSRSEWMNWLKLIHEVRKYQFDYAFELSDGDRGRLLTFLSGAKIRCTNNALGQLNWFWRSCFNRISNFNWLSRHSVERDFYTVNDVLDLGAEVPRLVFSRERTESWPPGDHLAEFVVLHPASRWKRNRWPVEKWIEVGRWILERVPNLIISVGPDPEEVSLARDIQRALGERSITTEGKLSWSQLANLFWRAKLLVVGDTGAMHLAAACQCPTVAMFRPCMIVNFSPWRVKSQIVTDPAFMPLGTLPAHVDANQQTIAAVRVEDVLNACALLLGR